MKRLLTTITTLALLASTGIVFAQDQDNHQPAMKGPAMQGMQGPAMHGPAMAGPAMKGPAMQGPAHPEWHKGGNISRADWGRGQTVDYRAHHLKRPPRGYEWRQVDGNYVLAAAATGLIASVILASH